MIVKICASEQIAWNMLWGKLCDMLVLWYFLVWAKIYIRFSSQNQTVSKGNMKEHTRIWKKEVELRHRITCSKQVT